MPGNHGDKGSQGSTGSPGIPGIDGFTGMPVGGQMHSGICGFCHHITENKNNSIFMALIM